MASTKLNASASRWWPLAASTIAIIAAILFHYCIPGRTGEIAAFESSVVASIFALFFSARAAPRLFAPAEPAGDDIWPRQPSHASIAFIVLSGLALSYHFSETGKWQFLHHIGIGLIVAGVVSAVWQLPEMRQFFIELAVGVMVDAKYLSKLRITALRQMRETSINALVRRHTTNPDYEIHAFADWLDSLLIQKLLPLEKEASGTYRTDYRERVAVRLMTLGEVLQEMQESVPAGTDLSFRIIKQTSVSTFRIVSPQRENRSHKAPVSIWAAQMPAIPNAKRVMLSIGTSQDTATRIDLKVKGENDSEGGLTFEAEYDVSLTDGTGSVWMQVVEYRLAESESWILNTFALLTYRLDVAVYVLNSNDDLKFDGNVIGGLGSAPPRYTHMPNGMTFHYDGWLLEDHGYFMWWWKYQPHPVGASPSLPPPTLLPPSSPSPSLPST